MGSLNPGKKTRSTTFRTGGAPTEVGALNRVVDFAGAEAFAVRTDRGSRCDGA